MCASLKFSARLPETHLFFIWPYCFIQKDKMANTLNIALAEQFWPTKAFCFYSIPDKSALLKQFFLFLDQNICFIYSKEPSQWDSSFKQAKHRFNLMDKNIIIILQRLCIVSLSQTQ